VLKASARFRAFEDGWIYGLRPGIQAPQWQKRRKGKHGAPEQSRPRPREPMLSPNAGSIRREG